MKKRIKAALSRLIPYKTRVLIYMTIPKVSRVNTYRLQKPKSFETLSQIGDKYEIIIVDWRHKDELIEAHKTRGPGAFYRKAVPRLNSTAWTGLAVRDRTNSRIAYLAWVITASIPYFEEFGIKLESNHFLLKDGYCVPDYRHQGLHTRMEQERINYCVQRGATYIYIQIHKSNTKGIASVLGNGYELIQTKYVLQWSIFNIYRALRGFLRTPFRKVVK